MSPKLVFLVGGLALAALAQEQNPNFIGKIERLQDDAPGKIAYIKFEPGARTRWHIHEKGQLVFVMEGVGLEQQKGGPVRELHAGDAIWCPPGVAHWHGAAPDQAGAQYNITRGGIQWLDQVTEAEYTAKAVPFK
jgi:4-carboxymuconolactone decarboxylase